MQSGMQKDGEPSLIFLYKDYSRNNPSSKSLVFASFRLQATDNRSYTPCPTLEVLAKQSAIVHLYPLKWTTKSWSWRFSFEVNNKAWSWKFSSQLKGVCQCLHSIVSMCSIHGRHFTSSTTSGLTNMARWWSISWAGKHLSFALTQTSSTKSLSNNLDHFTTGLAS